MSEKPTYEELWQRVQELEQKEYAQSSQIEDSFADTSELLSFFIKHSPIYAFIKEITNKASKVIYASDNYLDMTGIPASQMVGKTMEELFPEQFANKITGDDIDVVKNGKNLKLNEELNGKSYVTYKFPLMQNKRTLLAGYTIDISDLKQAEEGFAQIFNMSLDMICIADINASTLVKVNPAFTRILGYSEDELVQKSFYEFIHPDDIELTQSVVEEKLRQGTNIINFENRCRCKDGGYRWLSWVAHPDSESGKIYAIARDVTDYKKIEKSLETQNTLMRTLLENLQVGVFMIEAPSGKPLLANKRAKELIGRGIMPDADKTNLAEVYQAYQSDTGNIYPEDQLPVVRALMGEHHSIDDMYVVKPNGEKINLEVHGSPVFNDNNEITAGLISFTDITTKRRMEEQFRQAQKMESIGRLAGGVAHDFNNMLSIILGNIELIFDDLDPSNPVTKNLKEVQKAAKRSTNLTHQLLAFARKQTISPEIVDLNKAISGMLRMLRRLIGEDIDLKWLPRTALWPVKIDPSQVDQILANLCVNARDAIKDVGKITIETDNFHCDELHCRRHTGLEAGDYVTVRVSDNGCGMNNTTIEKLFEPFFTTKDQDKGTGLGLATVYGIVKQNNGYISVESEIDEGTTFKIYIPRHSEKLEEPIGNDGRDEIRDGHETILLVEDETAILEMIKSMLERLGYVVLEANTPEEAIKISRAFEHDIDLLITDVVMPSMNGRDLAEKLLTVRPHMKCLFMSGYTANVIAHRGILDEGVNFINKPFSMPDLSVKLRNVLDQ